MDTYHKKISNVTSRQARRIYVIVESFFEFRISNFEFRAKEGFTMVELLVGLTLFVVVVSVASTTFIQSLRSQRSIVALMAANDNASGVIEQMAREMRTGKLFTLNTTRKAITFFNQTDEEVRYEYDEIAKKISRNDSAVTSDNVSVEYVFFELQGATVGDGRSTSVNIRLGVSPKEHSINSIITNLQTTVSSRQLDT